MKLDPDSMMAFGAVDMVMLLMGAPPGSVLLAMPLQILAAVAMDTWFWPWLWKE